MNKMQQEIKTIQESLDRLFLIIAKEDKGYGYTPAGELIEAEPGYEIVPKGEPQTCGRYAFIFEGKVHWSDNPEYNADRPAKKLDGIRAYARPVEPETRTAAPTQRIGGANKLDQACDRIRDMLEGDDGQAWDEARKFLERIGQPTSIDDKRIGGAE